MRIGLILVIFLDWGGSSSYLEYFLSFGMGNWEEVKCSDVLYSRNICVFVLFIKLESWKSVSKKLLKLLLLYCLIAPVALQSHALVGSDHYN